MIIGKFTKLEDGTYRGTMTRYVGECVVFMPSKMTGTGQPDYVLTHDDDCGEVGVAWAKTSKKGNAYLSVKLDSPFQSGPINCALVPQKLDQGRTHALVWERDAKPASEAPGEAQ